MTLDDHLKLNRCPHCSIDNPNLNNLTSDQNTTTDTNDNRRIWRMYKCSRCGGVVTASANPHNRVVLEIFPSLTSVNEVLPLKVKAYLQQAIDSKFASSGSVMLCASAVDAVLKSKNYKAGSLYSRIKLAIKDGVITEDMGTWAHQVRLDANDERHSDDDAIMPTVDDANQAIQFTQTLAELLFVLPSKVSRGIEASSNKNG